MQSTVVHIC